MASDRIEKRIELKAPLSQVWRALTDYREFGQWFRVKLDGPFVPGQVSRGQITYPGYEHVRREALVEKMEPHGSFPSGGRIPSPLRNRTRHRTTRANQLHWSNSDSRRLQTEHCLWSRSPASISSRTTGGSRRSAGMTAAGRSR